MAALVVVLILCVSGLTAVSMQVRCIDAAREAARLAARGDGVRHPAQRSALRPTGPRGIVRPMALRVGRAGALSAEHLLDKVA